MSLLGVMLAAAVGEAKITIRPHPYYDNFSFHAQYSKQPFDPTQSFTLEIWNCASGAMPQFIADRDPIVVCQDGAEAATLANLVYVADLAAGACIDHGRSCYYRNADVGPMNAGIRYFRVQYSSRAHGNKVWLESYGDLSAATQASMLMLIKIDRRPRALLQDTFTPLHDGGWFSAY